MKRVLHLTIGFAIAAGLLAGAETVLRLAGFERESAPISLRFGYPNPREIVGVFRPDPRLFWRMRPGSIFDAEAPVPINASGYRGPLPARPRPAGLLRIAVMGDSVAFGAGSAWPEILGAALSERLAPRPVEVLNFGVPGYTVVQGWRQYEDDVADLRPDVVIVAYGWNDHWLARGGLSDSDRIVPSARRAAVDLWLSRLRLVQAVRAALPGPGASAPSATGAATRRRVPAELFESTIRTLAETAQAGGAVAIVAGLPSGLREGKIPGYLIDQGFTPSGEDALRDHASYTDRARAAAAVAGAAFVDAPPEFGDESFLRDRIHFSDHGHLRYAAVIEETLLKVIR